MQTYASALVCIVAALSAQPSVAQDCTTTCADLTGDGDVGVSDLLQLLASYDTSDGGDVTNDGATTVSDLLALLGQYGSSCARCAGGDGVAGAIPFAQVQMNVCYKLQARNFVAVMYEQGATGGCHDGNPIYAETAGRSDSFKFVEGREKYIRGSGVT